MKTVIATISAVLIILIGTMITGIITNNSTKTKIVSSIARTISPGYGACYKCGLPWSVAEGHSTKYSKNNGCFPLCENCWHELRHPANRMEYYMKLMDRWKADSTTRMQVIQAVNKGL